MKTPKAKKLPSGNWTVRVKVEGREYRITRETRSAAEREAMAIKSRAKSAAGLNNRLTLREAAEIYIENRSAVLSPSTICGYRQIIRTRFLPLWNMQISAITQQVCQRAVNEEKKRIASKTLKNSFGFVNAVLFEQTGARVAVNIGQVIKAERPFLDPKQIDTFLSAVKGKNIEIAALLALSSLRRSEILGLDWSNVDLHNRVIHIRGSAVYDENWKLTQKQENKNTSSRRDVPMIEPLFAALSNAKPQEGKVVRFNPSYLYEGINRVCEVNGLPKVGVHGLRHSFASLAYHLQIPERIAMQIGGWSNPATMHKIYTHLAESDISNQAKVFTDFFAGK